MNTVIAFLIGIVLGGNVGFIIAAVMRMEDWNDGE